MGAKKKLIDDLRCISNKDCIHLSIHNLDILPVQHYGGAGAAVVRQNGMGHKKEKKDYKCMNFKYLKMYKFC